MKALLPLLFVLSACGSLPTGEAPVSFQDAKSWQKSQKWVQVAPGKWKAQGLSIQSGTPIEYLLINGEEVPTDDWPQVKMISMSGASCTGTLVGPRALITAAHCVDTGGQLTFTVKGVKVTGVGTQSPLYKSQDHDIALALLDKQITSFKGASVAPLGTVQKGGKVRLMGYGCIQPGGGGGNDGKLRTGWSLVAGFNGYDAIAKAANGSALCYGDSGGPVFSPSNQIVAVNSKGNIKDTSYLTRLDVQDSYDFLQAWSKENGAGICGLNVSCDSGSQPPPPTDPKRSVFEDDKVKIQVEYK